MASPRLAKSFLSKRRRKEETERKRKLEMRRLAHELLEDRRMMAQGPSLVSIIPTDGTIKLPTDTPTFNVAPRDFTFRFAEGNSIDATSLANGFIVRSGGPDHVLGDTDDQVITPGFLGLADAPREVIMRFAATLPDDVYSVTLVGSGTTPLKDTSGNAFSGPNPADPNLTFNFTIDAGAQVDAIVPQPIVRTTANNVSTLQQTDNSIVVYYDQQMNATDVVQPSFYHLVNATSGAITLPSSVSYSDNATLTIQNPGTTLLSYNGASATSPLIVTNQTTQVTITSAGTTNTGTFTLSIPIPPGFVELGHQSTPSTVAIPAFGATPAQVLAALNAIPELNGNVAVTAGPGGLGIVEQFNITFQGAFIGRTMANATQSTVAITPQGTGTLGSAATLQAASNLTAAAVQSNLATISALAGKVNVTGAPGGPFNVAFTGTLAGANGVLSANNVPTAAITSTIQTLTLIAQGSTTPPPPPATTTLSFNGVPAAALLTVVTGTSGTTAAQITANLNTIPALNGHVAVIGPAGGPFTISVNTLPTGSGLSLITSSNPAAATTATTSQTLTLRSNGISILSFGGVAATTPLTVVTGPTGTLATDVQANLATIPAMAGVTVTGNQGGPFTITFPTTAGAANISLKATSPSAVVAVSSQQPAATLTFASPIPAGTFRLDIGTTPEPSAPEAINNKNVEHIGNSMVDVNGNAVPINAYIGDSLTATSAAAQANDVDLYQFDLKNDVTNFSVTVQPAAGLDAVLRIFDKNGNAVGLPINTAGAGGAESTPAGGIPLIAANGPFYVGISSVGNIAYNAATGTGNQGGTTTGGYSLSVTFSDLPTQVQSLSLVANDPTQLPAADGTINPADFTFLSYNGVSSTIPVMFNDQTTQVAITDDNAGAGTFTLTVTLNTQPTTSFTTTPIAASGATAADVLSALNAIPGLAGNVAVADVPPLAPEIEAFAITLEGALTGETLAIKFNPLGGTVGSESTSFASDPNTVTTTAGMVQGSLTTIPALQGNVVVAGPAGGPFNITFIGALAGTPVSLITATTPNVAITAVDDRFGSTTIDNSSFGGATPTGVLGPAGRTVSGAIVPPPDPSQLYLLNFPGSGDAPGDRQVPYNGEEYIQTPEGDAPDPSPGIETVTYDFQNFYGYSPLGDPLFNAITENQKQRAREIFELISSQSGIQFHEVDPSEDGSVQANITIVTGDLRAISPNSTGFANGTGFPVIPTSQAGNPNNVQLQHEFAILDAGTSSGQNWGNSEYGGSWFLNAMQAVSQAIGVVQHRDLPDLTPQNAGSNTEAVFPTPADVLSEQALHRPESNDIDVYSFTTTEPGLYRAETIAERLSNSTVANPDMLNTVLTLYKETKDSSGNVTRTEIARNDDYYGNDSYIELHLDPGTYYVAVTSTGNAQFDPTIADTGMGGRTQGAYQLSMSLKPDGALTSMRDATGIAFDGDGDGNPGGTNQFWFQSNTAGNTVYVDKLNAPVQIGHTSNGTFVVDSTSTTVVTNLQTAINKSGTTAGQKPIIRIVGNGGSDGDPNTLADDQPYLVGFKDANLLQPLPDGGTFQAPAGVTVMIDAGAVIKLRKANLNAGTTPQGVVSKAGSSIQVLGTPLTSVQITSYSDDTIGGDSNPTEGPALLPQGGDFGGIVFRDDSDHERDWQNSPGAISPANPLGLAIPVFLNYVNHATINYGGGKVTVDSVQDVYDPIYMDKARPTLTYNTIQSSANAAMSASPNTFDDDGLPNFTAGGGQLVPFDLRRIGPDIHDNIVGTNDPTKPQLNNSIDGLFIRIRTQLGSPVDLVDLTTRWKATDIVYVVSENLLIAGTPGGSIEPGTPSPTGGDAPITTMIEDGRLRIDPGVIVKLGGARIETKVSSALIAEGTTSLPVIFTSIKDDRYGAGGSFDTNKDGNQTAGAPGQWGGFYFGPTSVASLDHVSIFYGGGTVPVEGGFDSFNAVETNQADLRLTNSVLQFNAGGGSAPGDDRNGRGTNDNAVIFVRGAQPIILGNLIRDNNVDANGNINATGAVISINANALVSTVQGDYGRSTGAIDRFTTFDDNHGPLVRSNRLSNNTINGMEVRAETLTTETVWDDTDMAHIVTDEIKADNLHVYGGLRLQSSTSASLVVKLLGDTAGLTATGTVLDITDRIGGTVQVIGQPGHPVVLTSLNDDSVSAGFDPSGFPLFDTNNNGASSGGVLPTGPEVNNGTLIDDDVPTATVGHFEARPVAGGDIGLVNSGSSSGVTVQGNTQKLINQNFIFQFANFVDVGSDGSAVDLASTTITMPPTLVSPDLVVSEGNFTAANSQVINWHVETTFQNGVATAFNTLTFSSTQPLGNLQFINYLDEDVLAPSDDLLYQVGTPGQANFRLFTLDGPERVGFAQGGIYTPGAGLVNATYDGFAADSFANLVTAIQGATGTTYSVTGNINTTNLPVFNDPTLGNVNGPGDVTTAMAWTVDPNATTATITTFLELIARNPSTNAGDWRSIDLDQNSNDTNVAELLESEPAYVGVNITDPNNGSSHGLLDNNRTPQQAQLLGNLAPNDVSGDDNRRLGFQVDGNIAADNPSDVDVYSFNADSGTEVWFDVDNTSPGLNSMIELVDANGNVLASATDVDPSNPIVTPVAPPTILSVPAGSASAATQQIKLSTPAGASSYVFYLSDASGDKTGPISSSATAAQVQAALSALPGLTLVPGTSVTGNATTGWTVNFSAATALLATPGGFIHGSGANVDPTIPTLPGLNQNVTASVLPGGIGLAQSADRDSSNGRDTYSTNPGPVVAVDSGTITQVGFMATPINFSFPFQMTSANHALATGDRVEIDDPSGNPIGAYTVTVQDLDHFTLDGTGGSSAPLFNAATWTKLVQTTRDPEMRVVLPNAANGTALKNSPWFIRVRSEPVNFNNESGNNLNPGLTSGQYQLQVRIQQQDEKPASTVRFSDIRFATNGIEVHGLPAHSPLGGETTEADTANGSAGNDSQTTPQFIGNLLTTDKNTISVGGQISSSSDVDWYQFDLNTNLTTFYGPGADTFAAMFDVDYADGIAVGSPGTELEFAL